MILDTIKLSFPSSVLALFWCIPGAGRGLGNATESRKGHVDGGGRVFDRSVAAASYSIAPK